VARPAAIPMAISEPSRGSRFPSDLMCPIIKPWRKALALFALSEGSSKIRTSKLVFSPARHVRRTPGVNLATSGCHRRLEPPRSNSASRDPRGPIVRLTPRYSSRQTFYPDRIGPHSHPIPHRRLLLKPPSHPILIPLRIPHRRYFTRRVTF
jgi:hypothetical protein